MFSDATGVVKGDDVRVAGVKVGSVKGVDIVDRTRALVTFKVDSDQAVTDSTHGHDPLPQPGRPALHLAGPGRRRPALLKEGDTIPLARTKPALDLTVLFNGFKPLFAALSPADINKLSYEIVTVFQGEGGTLESLLSHTASVTITLASRDKVIGSLIDNLNQVMVTIGNRDEQLSDLLIKLRVSSSRGSPTTGRRSSGSLDSISALAVQTSGLVTGIRPPLTTDVKQLHERRRQPDRNKAEIDRALQVLPIKLNKVGRTATYGSFFNFYLCNFKGKRQVPAVAASRSSRRVAYAANSDRCDLG